MYDVKHPRWSLVLALFLMATAASQGQELGSQVPPEFRIRFFAAQRDNLDGNYMEALRQTTAALEMLDKDPRVKRNLAVNHSFVKYMFLALRAEVLADMGASKAASGQYHVAKTTLENQERAFARNGQGRGRVTEQKAILEFVEGSVHRPSMDFSLGRFEGAKEANADPFRWKQCLDRCGNELRVAGVTGGRLAGRQLVELARATMHKPVRPDAPTDTERYRDAGLFLREARLAFERGPVWKKVVEPKNPLVFKAVDDAKDVGAEINLEGEVALKQVIAIALRDWVEWRLAQAELQARQEDSDPELGWNFDNAATQFDEMCNFLRVQFGGDDHPVMYRVRLSRAKWFIFCGLRELDELEAAIKEKEKPDGEAEALERAKKIAKIRSLAKDAVLTFKDMRATRRVTPLMEEQCAIAEISALALQLRLDELEKRLAPGDRAKIEARIVVIRDQLDADEFRKRANAMVDAFGNPKRQEQ
jgi:hypothetical protein